jgi:hypothetical protein
MSDEVYSLQAECRKCGTSVTLTRSKLYPRHRPAGLCQICGTSNILNADGKIVTAREYNQPWIDAQEGLDERIGKVTREWLRTSIDSDLRFESIQFDGDFTYEDLVKIVEIIKEYKEQHQ